MRAHSFLPLVLGAWTAVSAQTAPADRLQPPAGEPRVQREEPADPRRNQKIERIRIEDGGARIDELRYGGQTLSIVVQPKADVPEYEFQPTDLARSRPEESRDGTSSNGSARVWNLFRF